jgi:hypothetical protein
VEPQRQGLEVHDPRLCLASRLRDEVVVHLRVPGVAQRHAGGGRERLEPAVDEPVLQRGDERHPDDREGAEHDDREREAQPGPDAPERVHPRSRYPTPRTV